MLECFVQDLIFYSFTEAFILILWFRSDALSEYCSLFGIKKSFFIGDYLERQKKDPQLLYPDYLVMYHNCFLTRLLSCPKCACVWLALIFYLSHSEFFLVPTVALLGLIIYYITSFLERKTYE